MGCASSKRLVRSVNEKKTILVAGLNDAGKSTILVTLKFGDLIETITEEYSETVEEFQYDDVTFTIRDVDEWAEIDDHWISHLQNTRVVIFVVDSTDREHIEEARKELMFLLEEAKRKHYTDLTLLVFANKHDKTNRMTVDEIIKKLDLHSLQDRTWSIQATCGYDEDTMIDGLDWLARQLKNQQ